MEQSKDSITSQKRTPFLRSSRPHLGQYLVLKIVEFSYKIVEKIKFAFYIQYIIPNNVLFVIKCESKYCTDTQTKYDSIKLSERC